MTYKLIADFDLQEGRHTLTTDVEIEPGTEDVELRKLEETGIVIPVGVDGTICFYPGRHLSRARLVPVSL